MGHESFGLLFVFLRENKMEGLKSHLLYNLPRKQLRMTCGCPIRQLDVQNTFVAWHSS